MQPYAHDNMPAQETWLDCATADSGRLRVVLLAADPLAPRDATWFMDGYWPAVRFAADDRPTDWICES